MGLRLPTSIGIPLAKGQFTSTQAWGAPPAVGGEEAGGEWRQGTGEGVPRGSARGGGEALRTPGEPGGRAT